MFKTCFLVALVAACSGTKPPSAPPSSDLELGSLGGVRHDTPAPASPPPPVAPAPAPPPTPAPEAHTGHDFIADADALYRIAACGGDPAARIPETVAHGDAQRRAALAPIVERHCRNILDRVRQFRTGYWDKNRVWFDGAVPAAIPPTVVYAFGGGDLLSALVAFPAATEITTISLELAGDPRRLPQLAPSAIQTSLAAIRVEIGGLLAVGSNTSVNLSSQQRNDLPGQVSSFLIALVVAGYEPVSMRYFTLEPSGAIHYLDEAEIAALDAARGQALKGDWASPSFSPAFANVELRFKKPGDSEVRVHRHIAWNLGDDYLAKQPALLRHLEAKGKVTVLVKGASYLLARPNFSQFRTYLLANLAWMLSDSTGISPIFAAPAGMEQVTYGRYAGAFLEGARASRADQAFVELWSRNRYRGLGFRFGYVDAAGAGHLVITRPRKGTDAASTQSP